MDMTDSIIPRSDQINADELVGGPATYTIREVIVGKAEHPFDFLLVETDRAYRPSKTMRRVIVNAWGTEASNYTGRRLTLYREPTIKFGGQTVGGIRISHMSHISGPVEVMAQTTRGKRETFVVKPIEANPGRELRRAKDGGDGHRQPDAGSSPDASTPPTTRGGDVPPAQPDGRVDSSGDGVTGAQEPEASASPEPLKDAVQEQLAQLTSHETARLKKLCADLGIQATRNGIVEAWGDGARDLPAMIASVEGRMPV